MTYLQGSLCLDLLDHDVRKRLVKLERTVTFLTARSVGQSRAPAAKPSLRAGG